jgi:hypothetical protein
MLNKRGLSMRKIAQALREQEMTGLLSWHGKPYPPGNISPHSHKFILTNKIASS